MQLGIGRDRSAQRGEVLESELLRDDQHLGLVALHFVEPQLMDGCGRQVRGGALADKEGVVLVTIRNGPETGIGASRGNIGRGEKAGELHVSRQYLLADRFKNFSLDAGLIVGRDAGGKFLQRASKGTCLRASDWRWR